MISDEDSGDKKKKGQKNTKGQKENSKNSANLKQTKTTPNKGKVENIKKSKAVVPTPTKKSAEKPVLTVSEDEDVAELKNN